MVYVGRRDRRGGDGMLRGDSSFPFSIILFLFFLPTHPFAPSGTVAVLPLPSGRLLLGLSVSFPKKMRDELLYPSNHRGVVVSPSQNFTPTITSISSSPFSPSSLVCGKPHLSLSCTIGSHLNAHTNYSLLFCSLDF